MAPETSADRGTAVRARLLQAAAQLIPERGWTAVTTRTLAERAGVRPGLVHYHFASLPALLREAALTRTRHTLMALGPVIEQAPDPSAALDRLLGHLDGHCGTDPDSLMLVETYLAAVRDEELHRGLRGLLREFRGTLTAALAAGDCPTPAQTAAVLAAAIDGVMLHKALDPGLDAARVAPVLRRTLTAADPRAAPDPQSGTP